MEAGAGERKLLAILSGDVVGYSRLMATDEEATIKTLARRRDLVGSTVAAHQGRLVDFTGDNFLAEFGSAINAVRCGVEIQRAICAHNSEIPDDLKMNFRIGAHVGDVRVEGDRIFGNGVNVAARLEGLSEPGGLCMSLQILDQLEDKIALDLENLGEQRFKNIPRPVYAYRVSVDSLLENSPLRPEVSRTDIDEASPDTRLEGGTTAHTRTTGKRSPSNLTPPDVERPFPAYSGDGPYIFVSYAHDDAALVYPEIARLKEYGFNVWYDEGIAPGFTWRDEVALALTQCKVFLYFITPRSVSSSNCLREVNFCLTRERKILSVHLEKTELPVGLELSLSNTQAIIRENYSEQAYQEKLSAGLKSLLPDLLESIAVPGSQPIAYKKSIAILPLVNRSNDPDNEYLCDGISEELIGGLSSVEGLKVASQLSSFAFKNQNIDVGLMGKKLKVDHILSGSVQKAGNRVRISVLLSQVTDGSSLWSNRYNRELKDIFELQEDVAKQVVGALKLELGANQHIQLVDAGTKNEQAYEVFLIGLHEARKGNRQSLEQAVIYLQRAALLDPEYARVHWWLYFCYWRLIGVGLPREEMEPKAVDALNRAKATGFVPPVPWVKATRDLFPDTRPDQRTLAIEACEKIRQPDPEWRLFQHIQLGECLIAAGFNHGACDYYEYYLDRTNHDLSATWIQLRYRSLLTQLGRFEEAITLLTEFISRNQVNFVERTPLYSRTGQYEKAERDLKVLRKSNPSLAPFAEFYHLYWRRDFDAIKNYYSQQAFSDLEPLFKYWVCFLLGDIEGGIDHLEEDVSRGAHPAVFRSNIGELLPQSILREVEQHPRYQAILKQFGIDDSWRHELMAMANELSVVTGIYVQPDDDY
jgi:TolB-like protein/class 3 adenylate cyclase